MPTLRDLFYSLPSDQEIYKKLQSFNPDETGMGAGVEGYQGPSFPTQYPRENTQAIFDWLNKIKLPQGNVPEDFGGGVGVEGMSFPEQPRVASIPREPREVGLAGVMEQDPNTAEGWTSVPGTKSFMDPSRMGRYRREPGAISTAPAPRYGGAASFLNDLDAATDARLRTAEAVGGMQPTEAGVRLHQITGRPYQPAPPVSEIFKLLAELPALETQATLAGPLKELGAIDEQERQRRENAWLAQATSGGRLGAMPSEGLSTEGLKRIQQIITGSRADERLENEQARLAESERRGRMTGPSRSDIITRAQRILLESGRTVKKTPDGDLVVYQNNKPVKEGEKLLAGALKEAERQIRSGAP